MSVECSHCSLPVPAGLLQDGEDLQFCCNGCRVAYQVIRDHGLDGYYDIKQRIDARDEPAHVSGKLFAEFDDPAFHRLYCRSLPSGSVIASGRTPSRRSVPLAKMLISQTSGKATLSSG